MCDIETIVNSMISCGVEHEKITAVVVAIEAARKAKRSARNRRYYESKTVNASENDKTIKTLKTSETTDIKTIKTYEASESVLNGLNTPLFTLSPSLPFDKENTPIPLKEINTPPAPIPAKINAPTRVYTRGDRGERLSKDWTLPSEWAKWAASEGHNEKTISLEADKFRDFWVSKTGPNATKLDWLATWRNWMRNAKQAASPPKPRLTDYQARHQAALDACDRALGKIRDDEQPTRHNFDLEPANWRPF